MVVNVVHTSTSAIDGSDQATTTTTTTTTNPADFIRTIPKTVANLISNNTTVVVVVVVCIVVF